MDNTANFESEVLFLLRQLSAKKEKIQAEFAEALAVVDKEIEAVTTTAKLLRDSSEGAHVTIVPRSGILVPGGLRGKSVRAACIEIAKVNGGLLRITDAKAALVDARVISEKKNAWGKIYTTLTRSKEFEKDAETPGTFRLVTEQAGTDQQYLPQVRMM